MKAPVVITDEDTAAGFKLAGTDLRITNPENVSAEFEAACAEAELVLITARLAKHVSTKRLQKALQACHPQVVLIPQSDDGSKKPDFAQALRHAMGVDD